MNWLHYLLEANLYLAVFYAVYYLFLRNDTHYALSRIYLLATSIVSFVIPLLQVGFLKPAEPQLISVNLIPPPPPAISSSNMVPVETINFTWQDGLIWTYLLGIMILLIMFSVKIYQLFKLTRAASTRVNHSYKLIYVDDSNTAFSFFNFLFIGTKANGTETIIQHELVHIRQKHSADIIFVELLKIINWFNPFVYLLQASLKTLHEYIADEQTASGGNDVIAYSTFLVNNAYGLSGSSITHSFFNYNLLKKRIIMLNQKRSGNLARLKYLLAVPICMGLLCVSTLAFSKNYALLDIAPAAKADTDKLAPPPPPPPIPPVAKAKQHKVPPPPPPAPPKTVRFPRPKNPAQVTSKGYHYAESAYLINDKTDFRVIIVEKNGEQKDYFKSKASAADLKLLRDKYGYTFPKMDIYTKMPPPPPAPARPKAENRPPPPPPAPPVKNTKALIYVPKALNTTAVAEDNTPVILIDGQVYNLKEPLKKGQQLIVEAVGGEHAVVYTDNDLKEAIEKYGDRAKNGVIFAYGKTAVTIK